MTNYTSQQANNLSFKSMKRRSNHSRRQQTKLYCQNILNTFKKYHTDEELIDNYCLINTSITTNTNRSTSKQNLPKLTQLKRFVIKSRNDISDDKQENTKYDYKIKLNVKISQYIRKCTSSKYVPETVTASFHLKLSPNYEYNVNNKSNMVYYNLLDCSLDIKSNANGKTMASYSLSPIYSNIIDTNRYSEFHSFIPNQSDETIIISIKHKDYRESQWGGWKDELWFWEDFAEKIFECIATFGWNSIFPDFSNIDKMWGVVNYKYDNFLNISSLISNHLTHFYLKQSLPNDIIDIIYTYCGQSKFKDVSDIRIDAIIWMENVHNVFAYYQNKSQNQILFQIYDTHWIKLKRVKNKLSRNTDKHYIEISVNKKQIPKYCLPYY